ncbi:MAG: dihydrodipicolinate synthase family protein, partial [Planctomycetes bacterium]|nr:dihydrodipicolinate synthase family protein [Planctomycetota bacterium]
MALDLSGVWTALATPMQSGHPDREAWAKLVRYQLDNGVTGLVVCGTTGESATLTKDEKLAQIADTKELAQGRGRVMVGTGSSSTA